MNKNDFIIRVYGVYLNNNNQVLLTDEIYKGKSITKFPGGGLNKGEGTIECLKREFMEELNLEINVPEHFYTTDFYQESAFDSSQQVISIYYSIDVSLNTLVERMDKANTSTENHIHFKWVALNQLKPEDLTFPIDKKVAGILIKMQLQGDV